MNRVMDYSMGNLYSDPHMTTETGWGVEPAKPFLKYLTYLENPSRVNLTAHNTVVNQCNFRFRA